MNDNDDWKLLEQYTQQRSHDAFARLVAKYADMVFHTALRQTHDRDLAEDATQAVFIVLARRASSLSPRGSLGAWLHRTAMHAGANALRAESRRRRHERAVATERGETTKPDVVDEHPIAEVETELHRLRDPDRQVLAMHYLEGQTMPQVADRLGISGEAARKRLTRALDRLRARLRGASEAGVVAAISAIAAPPTHAPAIESSAVAGGAGGSVFVLANELIRGMRMVVFQKAAAVVAVVGIVISAAVIAAPGHDSSGSANSATSQAAPAAPAADPQMDCMRNLRDIGMAVRLSMQANKNKLPADLGSLLPYVKTAAPAKGKAVAIEKARRFICPLDANVQIPEQPTREWVNQHTAYVYLGNADVPLPTDDQETTVLMHEKLDQPHGERVNVLMVDGHVESMPREDAAKAIERSKPHYQPAKPG